MQVISLGFVLAMLGSAAGCSISRAPVSREGGGHDAWVRGHGGVLTGTSANVYRHRIESAVVRLRGSGLSAGRVEVLDSGEAAAYAWRDGSIFVGRGLVDALGDEELAAALAHEMGHLINDGWVRSPVALVGHRDSTDCEMKADDVGCALLRHAGLSEATLARTLRCVAGTLDRDDPCRKALAARVARLVPGER